MTPGPVPGAPPAVERLRFRFCKLGKVRFTSQRDVARMWERALRRSGLPVAWTEGFSPRPLLSFGLALPTGNESLAEYLDVRLEQAAPAWPPVEADRRPPAGAWDPVDLAPLLTDLLPEGVTVTAVAAVDRAAGSLQQQVTSCSWEMEVRGVAVTELTERIEQVLAAPSISVRRERKGRWVVDDLRPSVVGLDLLADDAGTERDQATRWIQAELATRPRGVRPGELLEGLGAGLALVRARRTHQWMEHEGNRVEPLPVDGRLADRVPPARGCAS